DLMRRYEGRDPEELLPPALPEPTLFQPNKEYVREVLASQVDFNADGLDIGLLDPARRYGQYQEMVHDGVEVASEAVIDVNREAQGREYRLETDGPHPVESLRLAGATSGKGA